MAVRFIIEYFSTLDDNWFLLDYSISVYFAWKIQGIIIKNQEQVIMDRTKISSTHTTITSQNTMYCGGEPEHHISHITYT